MIRGATESNERQIALETAEGLAKILKLSPFTIRRLGYRGAIREFRCGRAVRYRLDEILSWMEGQGDVGNATANCLKQGNRKKLKS